jgi:prophage maintenance system killer protein
MFIGDCFLTLNGVLLKPDRAESVEQMVRLAEGALDEAAFAAWLRLQPAPG